MKKFIIDKDNSRQRVDKYLKKVLPQAPSSYIYKMFRKKDVKVNGMKIKENYILEDGDCLELFLYEDKYQEFIKPLTIHDLSIDFDVVYEDENILIVNKPIGLLIHEDQNEEYNTLSHQVLTYLHQKGEFDPQHDLGFTPAPVHRLDRNTSGIVIFGKNVPALQDLNEMMKMRHCIQKKYLTIAQGELKSCELEGYMKKDENQSLVRMVSKQTPGAQYMKTIVKQLKTNKKFSLVEVELVTGRTHQIRIHLSSVGHPLLGDRKYGDFKCNRYAKQELKLDHQFLHAYKVKFVEPIGMFRYLKGREFSCPLPKQLEDIKRQIF